MVWIISSLLLKYAANSPLSHSLFPPASKFNPARDIPDLSDKVILVTGGNTGIGYCTVKELLLKNAKVYLAGRNPPKTAAAVARLKVETGNEAIVLDLDLSDLKSIKRAVTAFLLKEDKLDILFNNAGVMIPPVDSVTTQGYDLQFGTNVIGHYYLTMLLLPALRKSTAIHGSKARIVNISSHAHTFTPVDGIDFSILKPGPSRDDAVKKWGPIGVPGKGALWYLYGLSKMGNILFTHILNRYYGRDVVAFSVHPGFIRSDIQRHTDAAAFLKWLANHLFLFPTPMGALTQLWAGTTPEAARTAVDAYLVPWGRIGKSDERADSQHLQDDLKVYLEEVIRVFEAS